MMKRVCRRTQLSSEKMNNEDGPLPVDGAPGPAGPGLRLLAIFRASTIAAASGP